MAIKTMPLSSLEATLASTLTECADSGQPVVVDLPDGRLVAIHAIDPTEDDSLTDELLETSPEFRQLVDRSRHAPRKPFPPGQT